MRYANGAAVDDDPLVCAMLKAGVRIEGVAVETFGSAQEFLAAFDPVRPGCLVCDDDMPGMSGLELQQELNRLGAVVPVIFMTAVRDVPTTVDALQQGAFDFLLKPISEDALLTRIHPAPRQDQHRRRSLAEVATIRGRHDLLTPRELEVLRCMVEGLSNKETIYRLGIAARTVEFHRAHVLEKMQARSVAELVRMVMNLEHAKSLQPE